MNLERVFEIILQIYPRSFDARFGEELKLGFQDVLETKPTILEILRLMIDALTAAIWERIQATTWLYQLTAMITVTWYLIFLMDFLFPNTNNLINESSLSILTLQSIFILPIVVIAPPIAFLLRLERVPSRLEWFSMSPFLHPLFFFWLNTHSPTIIYFLNLLSPTGILLFAISHQWTRISWQVRLLKFSLGTTALTTIANLVLHSAGQAVISYQILAILNVVTFAAMTVALVSKSKVVVSPSN